MSNKLAIGLVITAGVSGAIKGIQGVCSSFKILRDESLKTTQKMGALAKTGMASLGTLASSATAVAGTIRGLADPAIKFESAMADVKKVVNFDTPEQFKEMGNDILKLTRTIPMAGEEIAAIVAAGGQSGVARENLLGYAKDAATMGVAFDMAAGDAGEAMATMANVLGKPITEMAQFGDVINHLSDNANSKAKDIVNVITRVGSDTRMLGLTEKQSAALGSTFLSMGKAPELAAQAVKGMSSSFLQLKAGEHAKELKQLGFTTKSFAAAMNKDAQGAISSFIEKVKKMPKDKQYPLLAKIFGKQYADDVLLLAQNTGEYNRQLGLLQETDANGNLKYIGSMQREFENRSNTTENKLTKLKNSLTEIAEKIGEAFLPVITSFVENITPVIYSITEWVGTNPQIMEWVLTVGGGIGAVVGGLLTLHSAFSFVAAGLLPFWKGSIKLIGTIRPLLRFLRAIVLLGGVVGVKMLDMAISFGKAILMMSRALLTNPIGLLITGIAVAAYLIYDNWGKIGPWFAELWQTVSSAFSSAWSSITNFCSEAWANISNFFTSGIGNITATILNWSPLGLFYQILQPVLNLFGIELPGKFSEFGSNLIQGLVNGIRTAWEGAKQIVSDLGDGIKGWFAEKLGIHSPSRVFKGYGVNVVEGLAIGMDNAQPIATEASKNLSSAVKFEPVLNSVETAFKPLLNEKKGFLGTLWDDVKFGANFVGNLLGLNQSTDFRTPDFNPDAQISPNPSLQKRETEASILRDYQPLNRNAVTNNETNQHNGIMVNFNPTINVNGSQNQGVMEQVQQGLNMSLVEFERMLNRVLDQRQRRAY